MLTQVCRLRTGTSHVGTAAGSPSWPSAARMGKTFKKRVQGGVGGRGGGARRHVTDAAAPEAGAALRDAAEEEEEEEDGDGLAPLGRRTRNAALQARARACVSAAPRSPRRALSASALHARRRSWTRCARWRTPAACATSAPRLCRWTCPPRTPQTLLQGSRQTESGASPRAARVLPPARL